MRLFKGRKGTDKPIEIFIALFVILAVAMVLLKMFSGQIAEKQKEMAVQQQEESAKQAKSDLDTYCAEQCTEAQKTLKDKVTFCTSYYDGVIDINKNTIVDFTTKLDNIQGYCEDRIYCAAYKPCGSLDLINCKQIICDYLTTTMGISDPAAKAKRLVGYDPATKHYSGLIQPGDCWTKLSAADRNLHWFTTFAQTDITTLESSATGWNSICPV